MIRNVILHLIGELPMKADIESLPTAADAGLLCTNLRTLEGRKPVSTEYLDSVFLIPYDVIRFIEITRQAIHELGLDAGPAIRARGAACRGRFGGPGPRGVGHTAAPARLRRRLGPGRRRAGRRAAPAHPRGMTVRREASAGAAKHRCYSLRP